MCASESPSVCTTYFKFGRKWSFRCTPQNVFFTGLPAQNIDYNMPQHCVACQIFNIFCAAYYNTFKVCAALPSVRFLLAAGCRLPPAVYMYFLHSLSYLLSAVCRLLLVLCCRLPVSFLRYALFFAVYCLLFTSFWKLSAVCFLLSAFSFAQRVRKFFSKFYKTCYMY
jgi:hypothetical protein